MGPWDPLGLFRSHSAWKAISNGGLFRNKGRERPWVRNRARNESKTNHLEHPCSLGQERVQNFLKTYLLEHPSALGPETVPKLTAGLLQQHPPSAWGLFKQHPPRGWGLPALFKQHPPMVWGLPGLFKQHPPSVWGLPALSKRHPTKTWRPTVATTGAECLNKPLNNPLRQVWATTPKNHNLIHFCTQLPAAGFCLFKRDPPKGFASFKRDPPRILGLASGDPQGGGGRGR